jgi:hypothetical protein
MGRDRVRDRTKPAGEAARTLRDRADRTVRATTVGIGAAAVLGGGGLAVALAGGASASADPGAATTDPATPDARTPGKESPDSGVTSGPRSGDVTTPRRPAEPGPVAHSGGS